jgi:hypothetical protein
MHLAPSAPKTNNVENCCWLVANTLPHNDLWPMVKLSVAVPIRACEVDFLGLLRYATKWQEMSAAI